MYVYSMNELYNVRFFSFIKKYDLLYKYQFGFRQGFGTDIALVYLIDKISKAPDEGEIVLGVFLDLSRPKAFDTNMFVTGNNIENPICLMNQ